MSFSLYVLMYFGTLLIPLVFAAATLMVPVVLIKDLFSKGRGT